MHHSTQAGYDEPYIFPNACLWIHVFKLDGFRQKLTFGSKL